MALISLHHVGLHFDGPLILEDLCLKVEKGRRIGVIGSNGAGKSTLLRILAGELQPTAGTLQRSRSLRLAYQSQELEAGPKTTVLEFLEQVFVEEKKLLARQEAIEEALHRQRDPAQERRLLALYQRLQAERAARGADLMEQRLAAVLTGLGLPRPLWKQPLVSFSGGERNLISLARILLSKAELILLDEPSNHLDLDGLNWFIRFMASVPAAIVMVSHDRHLLDRTVTEIWELEGRHVHGWKGNYSAYRARKQEARALQERQALNQQRQIKRLEFQARRLKDMARAYDAPGQARRAKAMLRRIERMEPIQRPQAEGRRIRAHLESAPRHGEIALSVKNWSFSYGQRPLFENASLDITQGQRVALLGPNGSGKSTLMKAILKQGAWDHPTLRLGKSVRTGSFVQFHEEALDLSATLLDWLHAATGLGQERTAALLHRFLFTRDDLVRTIGTLSGGEKSRLQLARLTHRKVNFLLLDEPTNHLDIQAAEQLEEMLKGYGGTLFIISHDRRFLEHLVDVVVEIRDRRLLRHFGSFESWWDKRRQRIDHRRGTSPILWSQEARPEQDKSARIQERLALRSRQRELRRLERRVARLEASIEDLEARRAKLHATLEAAYSGKLPDPDPKAMAEQLSQLEEELKEAYERWEEALEAREGLSDLESPGLSSKNRPGKETPPSP